MSRSLGLGELIYPALALTAAVYFAMSSLRGEDGLYRRIELQSEASRLRVDRAALASEVEGLQNRTRRLSDDFLDIDLLDQQARDILGYVRPDEIVIR